MPALSALLADPYLAFAVARLVVAGLTAAALLALLACLRWRLVSWPLAAALALLALATLGGMALRRVDPLLALAPPLMLLAGSLVLARRMRRHPSAAAPGGGGWGRRWLLGATGGGLAAAATLSGAAHLARQALATERQRVLAEQRRRPSDPWPRGSGAFLIGEFGAPETRKIYLEPGGALSPEVGSFGLSFWGAGEDGALSWTSGGLPLAETRHAYADSADGLPAARIETSWCRALWGLDAAGALRLDLEPGRAPSPAPRLLLVLRSVGPAGGPVHELEVREDGLLVNGRWEVSLPAGARLVRLCDEQRDADWMRDAPVPTPARLRSAGGWGHARIELPAGQPARLRILDRQRATAAAAPVPLPQGGALVLEGVPPEFAARLRAQIPTLLHGIVGTETRPGDPMNYPLQWLRDGAYVLVALARAGHAATASRLARPFAAQDFFGGFGAEADAPGLALWALGEVATALRDPAGFDREIWPHLQRKAALIEALLEARGEVRHPFGGPVVPRHAGRPELDLVAGPARLGLIDGKMDWERPILFVNAVSHLGLREAARIAYRLGQAEEAGRWEALAVRIAEAWRAAFTTLGPDSPEVRNDRTAIIGRWPSGIAEPEPYRALLERRWQEARTAEGGFRRHPLWTYFDLAEAHQWLRLGRADRAHATLDWFARHQPAPGLHTYWEGDGEENSFGLWQHVRGNLRPRSVHPHYWSSAESLLLSLEMLAYAEAGPEPVLVLGAGVQRDWLARPIRVQGIGTAAGAVGWAWDGKGRLTVEAPAGLALRPGPAFPPGTEVAAARHPPPARRAEA
jgi:hypothetical protein